ncbi:MAG TPA: tRNA pseudouridine(55) synthase TruB [Candidatus Babeliales bacterium]|nr:tRNA pseudouridine(55) synthase TruB [Candidatus Babeliales bacterium]
MNMFITSGFLLINKPIGISSYGCIGYLKRILRQKIKIGHAGTLDPFASGLLIIALGREATRHLARFMLMEKTYIATGKCGELTDTLDHTGTIVSISDKIPLQEDLYASLISFGSSYEQVPPLYSALKYHGNPLYALARQKIISVEQLREVAEGKRKEVQLYDMRLLSYNMPYFTIQARVSRGTYIRTLINDIAINVGSCATTYQLARTAIGPFVISQAIDLKAIISIEDINRFIISVDTMLPDC